MAIGKQINEKEIYKEIKNLLIEYQPDIVIITGHDAYYEKKVVKTILKIIKILSTLLKPLKRLESMKKVMKNLLLLREPARVIMKSLLELVPILRVHPNVLIFMP